jgi:hypothetical protein
VGSGFSPAAAQPAQPAQPSDKASEPAGKESEPVDKERAPTPAVKEPPVVQKKSANLYIDSKPTGASLTLDGKDLGAAPWSGPIIPGTYTITGTLRGYLPQVEEIAVGAGEGRHVLLELVPVADRSSHKPFYKKWVFWAGASAVAVGAGVLVYFIVRPSYDVRIDYP